MEQKEQAVKYLSGLLILGVLSISVSVLKNILIPSLWEDWLQLVISAGAVVCLYLLKPAGNEYRLSALTRAVTVLLQLVMLSLSTFLIQWIYIAPEQLEVYTLFGRLTNVALLILSCLGLWFEYWAHGELVSDAAPALHKKWRTLFVLQLGASVFYFIGTYIAAQAMIAYDWDIHTTYNMVLGLLQLPLMAVRLLYLLYLYRTTRLIRERKGENHG